jgi:hypothetical protein
MGIFGIRATAWMFCSAAVEFHCIGEICLGDHGQIGAVEDQCGPLLRPGHAAFYVQKERNLQASLASQGAT